MEVLVKLRKGIDGKARISPEEAAEEVFKSESPSDQFLCFLLLVSLGNELVQEVIEDLGKRGDSAISVDEALLILGDDLDELCEYCRAQAIMVIKDSKRRKKVKYLV